MHLNTTLPLSLRVVTASEVGCCYTIYLFISLENSSHFLMNIKEKETDSITVRFLYKIFSLIKILPLHLCTFWHVLLSFLAYAWMCCPERMWSLLRVLHLDVVLGSLLWVPLSKQELSQVTSEGLLPHQPSCKAVTYQRYLQNNKKSPSKS